MKKFLQPIVAILMLTGLCSCADEVCITCSDFRTGESQELCSTNRDERQEFQFNLIRRGYQCTAAE